MALLRLRDIKGGCLPVALMRSVFNYSLSNATNVSNTFVTPRRPCPCLQTNVVSTAYYPSRLRRFVSSKTKSDRIDVVDVFRYFLSSNLFSHTITSRIKIWLTYYQPYANIVRILTDYLSFSICEQIIRYNCNGIFITGRARVPHAVHDDRRGEEHADDGAARTRGGRGLREWPLPHAHLAGSRRRPPQGATLYQDVVPHRLPAPDHLPGMEARTRPWQPPFLNHQFLCLLLKNISWYSSKFDDV